MSASSSAPHPTWRVSAALAGAYSYRVLAAAVLALPMVGLVSASGLLQFERGDGRLFDPGGLYLLEVVLRSRELLAAALLPTLLALFVLAVVGLVPEYWLLAAQRPAASPRRAVLRLGVVALASWAARVMLGLLTLALALTARSYFASARDERLPLLAMVSVAALGLLLQLVVSFWRDLAEVNVVVGDASSGGAIIDALGLMRAAGGRLALRYTAAQLLGLGALLAASVAAGHMDPARGDGWRSLGAFALHQLGVLVWIGLRAAWLWSARRTSIALAGG